METPLDRNQDYHFQGYCKQQNEGRASDGQAATTQPQWMRLLPSNVNPHVKPPKHSVLHRRSTYPYIEHTRYSISDTTPPERLKDQDNAIAGPTGMQSIKSLSKVKPASAGLGANLTTRTSNLKPTNCEATSEDTKREMVPELSEFQSLDKQRASRKLRKRFDARNRAQKLSLRLPPNTSNVAPTSTLRRSSMRRKSTMTQDATCHDRPHTPVPSQDIAPARPPFFRELSSFFASRLNAGK